MAKKYSPNDIPNKQADWGRDTTYHNYPFSGRAVQKYIKEQLDLKAGFFIPDASNENYLIFADADNYNLYMSDPVTYASLLIATVPLESNYNVTISLEDTSVINNINYGDTNNVIKANFAVVNKGGSEIADNFDVTITIRNGGSQTVLHRSATYGTLFSINVDEYLQEGSNIVTLQVAAVTYKVGSSISITYNAIRLLVSDVNFDISDVYDSTMTNLSILVRVQGNGTKILQWKLDDNEVMQFDPLVDQVDLVDTYVQKNIDISALGEGRHTLQYRAVRDINGISFYSDIMFRDFIVYKGETTDTIIVSSFSYRAANFIDPTDNPILLGHIEQYMSKDIAYAIYNPNNVAENPLTITLGNNEETFNVQNGTVYSYQLKSFDTGSTGLVFELNETELAFNVVIDQSGLTLRIIVNTEFEFNGKEKTNSSSDKELNDWSFTGRTGSTYHATMSNFNYTERDGWTKDGLLIGAGSSLVFDYAPLNYNTILTSGGTFEFEFETKRVLNDDQIICDLRSNGKGILITASEAKIIWGTTELGVKYKAEENNRITFVINPNEASNYNGLVFIYVNGILSGVKGYAAGTNFKSDSVLAFNGSASAQILLKQVRCYNRTLNMDEVLNNYNLYRPTIDELLQVYNDNDIVESGATLSVDKLSAKTPIIIVTGHLDTLENTDNKNLWVRMDKIEVINMGDPTKNITLINPRMRPQGTSSMNYPKKNYRFYTQVDDKDGDVPTQMFDYQGNEITGADRLYSFKEDANGKAQPVNCWCLKADYAESSSTHNTGIARLWNNVLKNVEIPIADLNPNYYNRNSKYPCRTEAQKTALANNYEYDVRTTVDGFPIVLFYHISENDPLIFVGKYNWNNDKSTESVYGFKDIPGFDNSDVECWEVINGDHPENLFTDISQWDSTAEGRGWVNAFEARYPDKNTNTTKALYPFAQWVNSTQNDLQKFIDEKWDHLDVYKVAAYYVYLMRFGAVDQTNKNAMLTTEDGVHFFYINYDNDTINGLDNLGKLIYGYEIDRQTIDPNTGSYCYAGHASVLWNNLEADAEFMAIVKQVDQALYDAGLKYADVINIFNNEQSKKWCERLHNVDSNYKYLGPYVSGQYVDGIDKLQGSRDTHRQWWLSNRFARYDALNVVGSYKSNVLSIIPVNTTLPSTKIMVVVPSVTGQIYGYGKDKTPVVAGITGTVDVPINLELSGTIYFGEYINIYNMVFVKKLDLTDIAAYYQQINLGAINTDAFDSNLEELWLGFVGNNPGEGSEENTALTQIGGLANAKYLRELHVCKFKSITALNLSQNKYLEVLDARGCDNLTYITLPDAAPITTLYLPDNLTRFAIREITTLTTLDLGDSIPDVIEIKSCRNINGFTNNPSALYVWKAARIAESITTECSIDIDNINWSNVTTADIIEFGQYVKQYGTLSLKGVCRLASLTLEQVNELREVFGQNCFDADAALRFIGQGVFFTGPNNVLSDGTYNWGIINATGQQLNVSFSVSTVSGDVVTHLTQSGNNLSVIVDEITGSDGEIRILATISQTGESPYNVTKNVIVKKRIYPSTATSSITGETRIEGDQTYTWQDSTEGINTQDKYSILWTLENAQGKNITDLVEIKSGSTQPSCILGFKPNVVLTTVENGILKVTIRKIADNTIKAQVPFNVTCFSEDIAFTVDTDPYLMEVMHAAVNAQGNLLAASADFMTRTECARVVNEDLYSHATATQANSIFYNNGNPGNPGPHGTNYFRNNCTNLDSLKYFIGLTEIPEYCLSACNVENIIIPANITTLKSYSLTTQNIKNIIFLGESIRFYNNVLSIKYNTTINLDVEIIDQRPNNSPYIDSGKQCIELSSNVNITIKKINNCKQNFIRTTRYCTNTIINILDFVSLTEITSLYNAIIYCDDSDHITINIDSSTNNKMLSSGVAIGAESNNEKYNHIYLSNKITSIRGVLRYLHTHCNGNITSINYYSQSSYSVMADKKHKLYLLNNTEVCSTLVGTFTDKCIVVRHDMLSAFQAAFPNYANNFTDEFTPEGDPIDFTVTGDNVIGQAIGTVLHVSKLYNGYYADGTAGQEWIVEDVEQQDNFFPQNETNVSVQRIIPVTINEVTKSCTINQSPFEKDIVICKNEITYNNFSKIIYYESLYYGESFDGLYVNNKKRVITRTSSTTIANIKCNSIIEANSILIFKVKVNTDNDINLVESFSGQRILNNFYKEIDLSNLTKNVRLSSIARSNNNLEKIIFPKYVLDNNYLNTCNSCPKLIEISCLSEVNPSSSSNFITGNSTNGIFKYIFNCDYSILINQLPSTWTTQVIYPPYLIFKSANSFTLAIFNSHKNWDGTLEYSTDKEVWTTWDGSTTLTAIVNNGNYYLYLRGKNNTKITGEGVESNGKFVLTGSNIECNGDIRMLLNYEDPENTTMDTKCFSSLFYNNSSLIKAPDLPATTLSFKCYGDMFDTCTNLVAAPKLPATTLADFCYTNMFNNSGLTSAPVLSATTLYPYCYSSMFRNTNLVKSPLIRATTLATNCYNNMFKDCSSLNEVTLAYDAAFDTSKATDWLSGVAATGTFTKNSNLTIATGTDGIPSGWTVEDADPSYLEFSSPNSFTLYFGSIGWNGTIEYSTDLLTWTTWNAATITAISDGSNYKLYLRGKNNSVISKNISYFSITGTDVSCNGDIRTLLDYEDPENTTMDNYCFVRCFYNCSALIKAPKLPATILSEYCYQEMFTGCTNLTKAPKLPAISGKNYCYQRMFQGCTSLNEVTILMETYTGNLPTYSWLSNVAANGTFYKKAGISFSTGANGIPSDWTVVDIN